MNSKILFTLIFMLVLTHTFAQTKLYGIVTEQNSGKKPVANTIIKAVGANQVFTNQKGEFTLIFPEQQIGNKVKISVEKKGWEVVNQNEMNVSIAANPNKNILKIILCKEGTLEKAKSNYYKIAEKNLINTYTKLKLNYKENPNEIARLEEEYSQTHKQLEGLANEYSQINFDEASESELKAFQLLKEGKMVEFNALNKGYISEKTLKQALLNKQLALKQIAVSDSIIRQDSLIKAQKKLIKN